ncbi:flavin-containing monooxygenase [Alkalihalobacillus sp. 1P02AB]|uniref:flavin-containing monooxygenase n=1 Tax=Alkalihalobacillus sp. 1P02AB TaxID=3132260 RepID=UPI0039A66E15
MLYDVVVIGGGQAGLAVGYYLKQTGHHFLIIDENLQTGDSWRLRYDSLTLFTPRFYSTLPFLPLEGDPNDYPSKDEMADYLSQYAKVFELPILHGIKVRRLTKKKELFNIETNDQVFHAKKVVIATGAFYSPYIPSISSSIEGDQSIFSIHAAHYKNSLQIPKGTVLIVGAGNTGVQIAAELSHSHQVILSRGHKMKFLPGKILTKSIFQWFDWSGLSKVNANSFIGRWLQKNDPIIGGDIKRVKKQVILAERLKSLQQNVATFIDGRTIKFHSIIWATGYKNTYEWIQVNQALDKNGQPLHNEGISPVNGLYFIGLSWQRKRGSALIHGVEEDAEFIVKHIVLT